MLTLRQVEWAAGFLEGEGCFYSSPLGVRAHRNSVTAAQVQREPLQRLVNMFGGAIYNVPPKKPTHAPAFVWTTTGARAVGIAMTVYSLMSPKRKMQIGKLLSSWRSRNKANQNDGRTHCKNGHELSGPNLYVATQDGKPKRHCKACKIDRQRVARAVA